jgi:hemoglobin/transferrin/lactoferrin receptor protein
VTGVRLTPVTNGLTILLETESGAVEAPLTRNEGNTLIAEISNAVLVLPEAGSFQAENPAEGIVRVVVSQVEADRIQVTITGADNPPELRIDAADTGIALTVTPEAIAFVPEEDIQITLSGTRTPRTVDQSSATVTVQTRQDLDRNQTRTLRDLVQYEPNVTVRNNSTRYGIQDINIRGLEGSRILIQADGIRLPQRYEFGSTQLGRDYVELETLKTVEILRGPASTLYGSDALGGVVTFATVDPADFLRESGDDASVTAKILYGSANDSFAETAALSGRYGRLEGLFLYTRRDGFQTEINSDTAAPNPQTFGSNSYFGKLVYRFDEFSQLKLTGESFERSVDTNLLSSQGLVTNQGAPFRVDRLTAVDEVKRERVSLGYEFRNPDQPGFLQGVRFQLYYQQSRATETSEEFRRVTAPFTGVPNRLRSRRSTYDENIYGGDLQFESNFTIGSTKNRLTYGIDLSNTEAGRIRDGFERNLVTGAQSNRVGADFFPVKDFPDADIFRLGIYLQNEIEFANGNLTVIPGLRYDYYSLDTQADAQFSDRPFVFPPGFPPRRIEASDFEASAVSPRLGVVWRLNPTLSLFGQYARGFRAPLYNEIAPGFVNTLAGYEALPNPDLKPETSDSFELGLRGKFSQASFSIAGFYNTYKNFISEFVQVGTNPTGCSPAFSPPRCFAVFQSRNIGEAEIYGVELRGEYRFSPDPGGLSAFASLGYTVGNDKTVDLPLETIPPIKAVVGLRYRDAADVWGAQLTTTIVGEPRVERTADRPNPFIPGSYATVDLVGYYKLGQNAMLTLGVYNLTDSRYFQYADVRAFDAGNPNLERSVQPGINVAVGFSFQF